MHKENHFDYIIIGNGLAGLQLALGFLEDSYFQSKRIALIDPSAKNTNDKTWSFWEQGECKWDAIIHKSWNNALFKSKQVDVSIPLNDYTYKSIRSIDFYEFAKHKFNASPNVHFILDEITAIEESEDLTVFGKQNKYTAAHVFDSRIPLDFFKDHNYTVIHQHFKGWIIKVGKPTFTTDEFTMMDYRFQHQDSTSFIYVLPFSETEALIEFTFFTPFTVEEPIYDVALEKYIKNELHLDAYSIIETEIGNIPMTDFPFWEGHSERVTKIGTGGGWVKGSTGYSFKHTEKNVARIINNIKNKRVPSSDLVKNKFKFYDAIFLDVLKQHNEKGPWIFKQFYTKNSVNTMFRFLDEETSFLEDVQIMTSLFSAKFINAFFRVLFR